MKTHDEGAFGTTRTEHLVERGGYGPGIHALYEVELVSLPGCEVGEGVVPDVVVRPTEEAFLSGADPWMEALDALVRPGAPTALHTDQPGGSPR